MKSKIEKIGCFLVPSSTSEGVTDALQSLADKLNEIIDHLNSQDQGEEKTVCEGCGKAIISRFMQSYSRDDGLHYYCLSCNPETEDTPEEWEKELEEIVNNIDIKKTPSEGDWIDKEYKSATKNVLIEFIKQLLEEREREVITAFLNDTVSYNSFHKGKPRVLVNGLSGEGFEVRVSKLKQ